MTVLRACKPELEAEDTDIEGAFVGPDAVHLACGACRTVLVRNYRPRPPEAAPTRTRVFCPVCDTRNRVPTLCTTPDAAQSA